MIGFVRITPLGGKCGRECVLRIICRSDDGEIPQTCGKLIVRSKPAYVSVISTVKPCLVVLPILKEKVVFWVRRELSRVSLKNENPFPGTFNRIIQSTILAASFCSQ